MGRPPIATAFKVTLPLIAKGLLAGGGLVFLTTMKELPATLLLRPTEFETLAVRIWSTTSEGFYTRASFAALVLIAVSAVPLHLLITRDLRLNPIEPRVSARRLATWQRCGIRQRRRGRPTADCFGHRRGKPPPLRVSVVRRRRPTRCGSVECRGGTGRYVPREAPRRNVFQDSRFSLRRCRQVSYGLAMTIVPVRSQRVGEVLELVGLTGIEKRCHMNCTLENTAVAGRRSLSPARRDPAR